MTLWNKFTAWLSGWPKSTVQGQKLKKDDELFAEAEAKSKSTPKPKKPKGLNPKKKKKKGKKQGNSA
jgi:hypothetical protein|tara:strand:+ start:386 stop:586 length:201 start_codon:yes stop_codon:yes gene_type:complete